MGRYNMDSKLIDVYKDKEAMEIIVKYIPMAKNNPMVKMVGSMPVSKALQYGKVVNLTNDQIEELKEKIFALE